MINKTTDIGLRKAMKAKPASQLSSNFVHHTMMRVNEKAWQKEKRQKRIDILMPFIFGILSIISCLGCLLICFPDFILGDIDIFICSFSDCLFCLPILIALLLLGLFNRLLRRWYLSSLSQSE